MNDRFTLEVPLLPEYVSTARLFMAAIGRSFDLNEETVADLKMAVSEACAGAIHADRNGDKDGGPILLSVQETDGALVIQITSHGRFGPAQQDPWDPDTPTELFQKALGVGVIHSLFPDVKFGEEVVGQTTMELRVALTPDEA